MCVHSVCVLTQCSYSVYALIYSVCVQCVYAHSVLTQCVRSLIQCVCVCVCTQSVYIKLLTYPDMTKGSQVTGCREKKHLMVTA